jgi:hypothetical protein
MRVRIEIERLTVDRCRHYCRVEHPHIPRQRGDDEMDIHCGNRLHGDGATGIDKEFQPFAEPVRVETLVLARSSAPPQIQIEDTGELRGCRCGNDVRTFVKAALTDQLVQRLWRKATDDPRKLGRIEWNREVFRHQLAMLRDDTTLNFIESASS